MRIEVCIDRTKPLPIGALEALSGELSKRINKQFSETQNSVQVRYAGANNLSVLGGAKTDKDIIEEILQETWESADDWFSTEGSDM
ncbi:DNA damage-inducible protein I [Rouxiella silvae]|uniref:DNA damage-inducible protein I n=1 Tax=Rouxiella silvae TaxID=1646373 RepID=A0AA40WZF7_9GAMM|nr:DNA damage-inducible protein I [Rouxiella silvae]KQN42789.1 damage-inducible protein I [Serratia sp. Leaf50]MBF6635785.1 DNA damage-inducible protein I [Rouxiella silvae]ORJ20196.1 DNA damage-inducible protein I [Rouxiella silvae]